MTARMGKSTLLRAVGVGAVGSIIAWLSAARVLNQRAMFISLTLLLLAYLAAEVRHLRHVHSERWLINPIVLASLVTFALTYGVSNVIFFLPPDAMDASGVVPDITPAMVKLMWLVLIAAVSMWLGYWSPIAARLTGPTMRRRAARWVRGATEPRRLTIPVLMIVSLVARGFQIRLGIFGYNGNYERFVAMGSITQYLSILASLGLLGLLLATLTYYRHPQSTWNKAWLVATLVVEIGLGLLSGMKSQVAMPFVVVGVCKYLLDGRIPLKWITGFAVAIAVAYAVIQPYRALRQEQRMTNLNSLSAITSAMKAARTVPGDDARNSTWLNALVRSSQTYDGAQGVEFRDGGETLPAGSPTFLRNLLLAPAYAWIPRFILPSKPLGDFGLWYTRVVESKDIMSSTASGPVTYLYFAGGATAIVVFCALLGILYRAFFFLLSPVQKPAGALIYFGMLSTLVVIPSSVDGMVVDLFRILPLLVVLQLLSFRRLRSRVALGHDVGASA